VPAKLRGALGDGLDLRERDGVDGIHGPV
jgi:hypothetical protein